MGLLRTCIQFLLMMLLMSPKVSGFDLLILHTNDLHDRIEETNKYSGSCSAEDSAVGKCFGGVARLRSKVNELRRQYPDSLLLDAGDQFQGTLWYFKFGGSLIATFMNLIGYDAMGLGNHEFDNGVSGLVPLAENVSFPLLSANIDLSETGDLQGKIFNSTIKVVNREKIGVIGYTTTETPYISNPETVKFKDELTAIQEEADKLIADGVNKIIAVGHGGYTGDVEMARSVRGVDVIVGGHSNTLLYNGEAPSNEDPVGAYPTVIDSDSTVERVLVVQSYAFGKYLGRLHVTFDDQGRVTNYSGNPVLLDGTVEKDNETEALVARYRPEVIALDSEEIGSSHVHLDGVRTTCRQRECNLGNLIADGLLKQNLRHSDSRYWSDVGIAIQNSGGIRASIEKGPITIGDVIKAQPFRNTIDIIEITGSTILRILEHSAKLWDAKHGGFLQLSGLRVVYDMSQTAGSRVVDVQVLCAKCQIPRFKPLNITQAYQVIMNTFLANGGDTYTFIPTEILRRHVIGNVDSDILRDHIKASSPVIAGLDGRIRFIEEIKEESLWQTLKEQTCPSINTPCKPNSSSFSVALNIKCMTFVSATILWFGNTLVL